MFNGAPLSTCPAGPVQMADLRADKNKLVNDRDLTYVSMQDKMDRAQEAAQTVVTLQAEAKHDDAEVKRLTKKVAECEDTEKQEIEEFYEMQDQFISFAKTQKDNTAIAAALNACVPHLIESETACTSRLYPIDLAWQGGVQMKRMMNEKHKADKEADKENAERAVLAEKKLEVLKGALVKMAQM